MNEETKGSGVLAPTRPEPTAYLISHAKHGRALAFQQITDGDRNAGFSSEALYTNAPQSTAMTASAEAFPLSEIVVQVRARQRGDFVLSHEQAIDLIAPPPSDAAREAVLAIVKDAFNRGVRSGMKEHTSSKGGNTWVEERPALESRLNAALSAAPVSAPLGDSDKLMARKIEDAWDIEPTPFNRAEVAVRVVRDEISRKLDLLDALSPPRKECGGAR